MTVDRRMVAVAALAAAAVLALLAPSGWNPVRHGADAGFTYGYLPSLARASLDFSDDSIPFDSSMPHTRRGYAHNAFPIGPAVWWSPAFVVADATAAATRAATGSDAPSGDGRSWPYDVLVGLAALGVGVVGVVATASAAARVASRRAAAAAALLVWLAGPAVYYTHAEPTASHTAGFASAAVLLAVWLAYRDGRQLTGWHLFALGLLAGFAALCRWQNAVFALGPLLDVAAGRLSAPRRRLRSLAAFAAGGIVGTAPQLAVWAALYGSPLRPPRGEASGAYLGFGDLHLVEVLFSSRHGLYSWHAVLGVGTVGLVVLLARRPTRAVGGALVASILLAVLVNASVLDWWAGASFGARRFDGAWPAFALGVAAVVDRVPWRAAVAAGVAMVLLNWRLLVAYTTGRVSRVDAVPARELLEAVAAVPLAPGALDWTVRKAVWVIALGAVGALALRRPRLQLRLPSVRTVAVAGAAAGAGLVALVTASGWERGPFDPQAFEAGYFVPQATRPARSDRVVQPGEDVWTLVWAMPGFLPPGRYVAVAEDVRARGAPGASLVVRVDGAAVVTTDADEQARAAVGDPFTLRPGFVRLDVEARGGPVHLDLVRLVPAPQE